MQTDMVKSNLSLHGQRKQSEAAAAGYSMAQIVAELDPMPCSYKAGAWNPLFLTAVQYLLCLFFAAVAAWSGSHAYCQGARAPFTDLAQ